MPMDSQASSQLQKELASNEKLLWAGRPKQGLLFRWTDVFMIPFSLLWLGFVIFWEYSAASGGAPVFFMLFGGVFVVVGLYFVFGRFIWDSLERKRTIYGVTDERVIIFSGIFQYQIKSLNLRTLSDISVTEKSSGSGTVSLGPTSFTDSMYNGMAWPGMTRGSPKFRYY